MLKSKKLYYPIFVAGYTLLPLVVLAQDVISVLSSIRNVLNIVIGILFVLATVVFLWGVIQFIAKAGDPEGQKKAKGVMVWGIIGLAVMAAAWGVANILVNFFQARSTPSFVEPPRIN